MYLNIFSKQDREESELAESNSKSMSGSLANMGRRDSHLMRTYEDGLHSFVADLSLLMANVCVICSLCSKCCAQIQLLKHRGYSRQEGIPASI